MSSKDHSFDSLFDFAGYVADSSVGAAPTWKDSSAGVPPTWKDLAPNASNASNAYNYASQDIFDSCYASQDPPAPAFDAFASSVASTSTACGWADRDHVTFGPDGAAPLLHPFVNPVDICDVVPVVPPSASELGDDDDEAAPEDVAVAVAPAQPEFDVTLEQRLYEMWMDGWRVGYECRLQGLPAEPAAVNEYVIFSHPHSPAAPDRPPLSLRPKISVKPSAPRPGKRQRAPDSEIYPDRPKKSKCMYSPLSASTRASRSPTPTPPAAIVVVPTDNLGCAMPGCGADLSQKDGAWRNHLKTAHHKEVCTDSSCDDAKGCKSARCPTCEKTMSMDSLGRHMLNKHIGVLYRCPVCGEQKQQRKYAIDRHIKMCFANSLKAGRA